MRNIVIHGFAVLGLAYLVSCSENDGSHRKKSADSVKFTGVAPVDSLDPITEAINRFSDESLELLVIDSTRLVYDIPGECSCATAPIGTSNISVNLAEPTSCPVEGFQEVCKPIAGPAILNEFNALRDLKVLPISEDGKTLLKIELKHAPAIAKAWKQLVYSRTPDPRRFVVGQKNLFCLILSIYFEKGLIDQDVIRAILVEYDKSDSPISREKAIELTSKQESIMNSINAAIDLTSKDYRTKTIRGVVREKLGLDIYRE